MAKGIIANIANLFKTTEQLEREKRERKRMLERGIEKSIDALSDAQREAAREQEKYYQQAKEKLSVGRENEARQYLQFSRMQSRNSDNYTRQKLMWSSALTQLRVASSVQTGVQAFCQLAAESGLDPALFENGLESMSEVEQTIGEINKAMAKKWEKDSLKASDVCDMEGDATIDEMMERARGEVAAENGIESADLLRSQAGHR